MRTDVARRISGRTAIAVMLLAACGTSPDAGVPSDARDADVDVDATSDAPDGAACTPQTFDGPPVTGLPGQWQWVDVPEARCRDGSSTGFGIRLQPSSDRLMIYFEGGGACFNAQTCSLALSNFGASAFEAWAGSVGQTGIFDGTNAANPVAGWNMVYVPYCTGDLHAGAATAVDVPGGPTAQSFVGYANVGYDLQRIVPTFPNVQRVLVTGISGGGHGALFNFDRIADAYCPREVTLLDDSGPLLADAYLAPCLQQRWRDLWGLNQVLPSGCSACTGAAGGGLVNYTAYLAQHYPGAELGVLSSRQDSVLASLYGYGQNGCANLDGSASPLPGGTLAEGLDDLRANYLSAAPTRWSSYYVDSTTHTYLLGPGLYTTTAANVPLTSWIAGLVSDAPATQVGP